RSSSGSTSSTLSLPPSCAAKISSLVIVCAWSRPACVLALEAVIRVPRSGQMSACGIIRLPNSRLELSIARIYPSLSAVPAVCPAAHPALRRTHRAHRVTARRLIEQQRGLLEHRGHIGDEPRDHIAIDDAVVE